MISNISEKSNIPTPVEETQGVEFGSNKVINEIVMEEKEELNLFPVNNEANIVLSFNPHEKAEDSVEENSHSSILFDYLQTLRSFHEDLKEVQSFLNLSEDILYFFDDSGKYFVEASTLLLPYLFRFLDTQFSLPFPGVLELYPDIFELVKSLDTDLESLWGYYNRLSKSLYLIHKKDNKSPFTKFMERLFNRMANVSNERNNSLILTLREMDSKSFCDLYFPKYEGILNKKDSTTLRLIEDYWYDISKDTFNSLLPKESVRLFKVGFVTSILFNQKFMSLIQKVEVLQNLIFSFL